MVRGNSILKSSKKFLLLKHKNTGKPQNSQSAGNNLPHYLLSAVKTT